MSDNNITNYVAPPTVAKFMLSDAPMRLIMGPVGCTDADTEFLTPNGWKRIADYEPGDLVMQWEENGAGSFVEPEAYINAPNPDGFWSFENEYSLNMMLTPGHRMPLYNWRGDFVVKPASRVAAKPSKHQVPVNFELGGGIPLTDVDIRMRVMVAADGSYPKNGNQCVVCVRRDRKKIRMRELLAAAGVEYDERVYPGRPTETLFVFRRPDFEKPLHLSADWYRASSAQLEVLLHEILHWDGLHNHEELRFDTTKPEEAAVVQFAAHACGRRASLTVNPYDSHPLWNPIYRVHWTNVGSCKAKVGIRCDTTKIQWHPSNGANQYCFTVPSSFWVARRNGCIFVTGNSGKSVGCIMEIARRAQQQRPARDGIRYTRCVVVRNTISQLKDTVLKSFLDWMPNGIAGVWNESRMTFTMKFGDVNCEVLFRALDTPDDVRRLLSLEPTFIYINEMREIPLEIVIACRSRAGRYPSMKEGGATWHGVFGDTNPPSADHYLHQLFEIEKPKGWEIFKQPGGRTPEAENVENLPAGYYENMCDGADDDFIKVHVDAQYGRSKQGMPVYESTWKTSFHTRSALQIIGGAPVVIGLDAGRTPAASFFQKDPKGRILLLDELTSTNMGMELFLATKVKPLLAQRYMGHRFLAAADPAVWQKSQLNETSVADIIKAAGFYLPKPYDMSNRIGPRLQAVESLLRQQIDGEAMFLVDKERCPQAVAGFEHGYRFKRKKDGQFEEVPDKSELSHLHDSIQYGCQVVDSSRAMAIPTAQVIQSVDMRGWT